MKKLFLFFLLIALTRGAYCQLTQSTVGQIYNFSVGDTFECNCDFIDGGCNQMGYESYVILSRQDAGEFINYTIKEVQAIAGPGCPNTPDSFIYNATYGPKDSAIFWYHTYHAFGCDSNGLCYTDTVYNDTTNQRNWKVNEHKEGEISWYEADTAFADGLGQVLCNYGSEDFSQQQGGCSLTYYHKVGQQPWGQYVDIRLPTGIDEIKETGASIKAFPNPFNDVTHIVVTGINEKFGFELYDVTGRLQQTIPAIDNNQFDVHKGQLANGVYLYRILVTGKAAAYGKLVVE
jgi:hypothetical protein